MSGPAVLVGAPAAGLLVLADTAAYARLGVPVPSLTAQAWVAGLRAVAELAGGLPVGSLVFAAFVVGPQRSGVLDVDRWLAVRRAGVAAGVAGVVAVLLGVRRLARRGDAWPGGRTLAWLAGCAVLLVATSSGSGATRPACSACTWPATWR